MTWKWWDKGPKRYVVLCKKIDSTYHKIRAIKVTRHNQEDLDIGLASTIAINTSKPTYFDLKGLTYFHYHDADTGAPIPFIAQELIIDPKVLNKLLRNKVIRDLGKSLEKPTYNWKDILIGGVAGTGLTGFVMMILFYVGLFQFG